MARPARRTCSGTRSGLARTTVRSRSLPHSGHRPVGSDVLQRGVWSSSSRQVPAQPAWLPAWPPGMRLRETGTLEHDNTLAGRARRCRRGTLWSTCHRWCRARLHRAASHGSSTPSPSSTTRPRAKRTAGADFLDQVWERRREHRGPAGVVRLPADARHRQQKILMMVGPKRSGRGTIAAGAQGARR